MLVRQYVAQPPVTDFGLQQSNLKFSASISANTDTTLVVPGDQSVYKAVIKVKSEGLVWFAVNALAHFPAGVTFAATASELISDAESLCRQVKAGDVLHFYTAISGIDVSVVFYALVNSD